MATKLKGIVIWYIQQTSHHVEVHVGGTSVLNDSRLVHCSLDWSLCTVAAMFYGYETC